MYTVLVWSDEQDGFVPAKEDTGKVISYPSWSEAMDRATELKLSTGEQHSVAFIRPRRKVKRA